MDCRSIDRYKEKERVMDDEIQSVRRYICKGILKYVDVFFYITILHLILKMERKVEGVNKKKSYDIQIFR